MKKIGLIGGMSWESSQVYYQIINEKVKEILGGFHSAKCVMESVDFYDVEKLQSKGDWEGHDSNHKTQICLYAKSIRAIS